MMPNVPLVRDLHIEILGDHCLSSLKAHESLFLLENIFNIE